MTSKNTLRKMIEVEFFQLYIYALSYKLIISYKHVSQFFGVTKSSLLSEQETTQKRQIPSQAGSEGPV